MLSFVLVKFNFTHLAIPDVIEIEHERFDDPRGFFAECFREKEFAQEGIPGPFVQENHSRSTQGVLRGLHYQTHPKAQGKLVRCIRGSIFDVAVDLRKNSAHFGKWVACVLSDENRKMLYVPVGFAHGFMTLSDCADVIYKTTQYYCAPQDRGIRWDDPDIAVAWPAGSRHVSPKDGALPFLKQVEFNF